MALKHEQKAVFIEGEANVNTYGINSTCFDNGWKFVAAIPQHIATGNKYSASYGGFLVILERYVEIKEQPAQ